MLNQTPTQSGRAGFVIALFGVIILAYGLLSGYGVWKALHADDPAKYRDIIETLSWSCAVSTLFGLALIFVGWKFARCMRDDDKRDPDDPAMKC